MLTCKVLLLSRFKYTQADGLVMFVSQILRPLLEVIYADSILHSVPPIRIPQEHDSKPRGSNTELLIEEILN